MRKEIADLLREVELLEPSEIPSLLGDLEHVRAVAFARLVSPAPEAKPDENIDVAEASRRLGMSAAYLYRHSHQFAFARRIGRKLLFSSEGLSKYLAAKAK